MLQQGFGGFRRHARFAQLADHMLLLTSALRQVMSVLCGWAQQGLGNVAL